MIPHKLILALLLAGSSLHSSNAVHDTPLLPANFESSVPDHFVIRKLIWQDDPKAEPTIIDILENPVTGKLASGKKDLHIVIDNRVVVPFDGKYEGMTVLLVNNTKLAQRIPTQDYRLYMTQEALDRHGEWRPIESLQMATCGNSYFNVQMEPMTFWAFTSPRYQGAFKTKLRFRWALNEHVIYSKEFKGSVNESQFEDGRSGSPDFLKKLGI